MRSFVSALLLLPAGIVLMMALSGCATGVDIRGDDSSAFFPFVRVSVPLVSDAAKADETPETASSSRGKVLRQGLLALDLETMRVRGNDENPSRRRIFTLSYATLALRGSTRPAWLGGLYFEGLAGLQRAVIDSTSEIGVIRDVNDRATGWLIGIGAGYAFSDRLTVHARSQAGLVGPLSDVASREVMATYWFNRHAALSGGYRWCEYSNEFFSAKVDFQWSGPAVGLELAF